MLSTIDNLIKLTYDKYDLIESPACEPVIGDTGAMGGEKMRMKRCLGWVLILGILLGVLSMSALAEVVIITPENQENETGLGDGVELKPGEKIKEPKNYAIEYIGARFRSDDNLNDGCWIGYFTSAESGIDTQSFEYPVGTHMPVSVNYAFTNMMTEDTELLKRVRCQIVYDGKYVFDTVPMQVNPNQLTSDGKSGYASTVGVPVEPLVSVGVRVFASLPIPIRDSDRPLVAVLTIDGTDVYETNLRDRDAFEID